MAVEMTGFVGDDVNPKNQPIADINSFNMFLSLTSDEKV